MGSPFEKMEKLVLYYDLLSPPSRALFILLSSSKIPFEAKAIRLGKGEHRTEEYRKINPFQLVPAISDGEFNLTESVAIVRYLYREKRGLPDHWYPRQSQDRARVDEFLEYQPLGLRIQCGLFFRVLWAEPFLTGEAPDEEYAAVLRENMVRACDTFQQIWLADKPFICGDSFTVADLFAACDLEQPKLAGYDAREGRPVLSAWMERVRRETQPHYDAAHSTLNRISTKYQGQCPALLPSKL